MQEWQLYNLWENYASTKQALRWQQNILKIENPGILNEHHGPDYRGSRFKLNGITYQGAVEIHVDAREWYQHKHHLNPLYRDVLLHIVALGSHTSTAVHHVLNDTPIPTFVLPVEKGHQIFSCEAVQPKMEKRTLLLKLQILALDRLRLKVHCFEKKLQQKDINTVFYESYFRTLGYPNNKHTFELLANRVNWATCLTLHDDSKAMLALFMGVAGFLEKKFKQQYPQELSRIFRSLRLSTSAPLHEELWQFSANRNVNHPHFRIAGWVKLVQVVGQDSPFFEIYNIFCQRKPFKELFKQITKFLQLTTHGYWQNHFALDKCSIRRQNYFLGDMRLREMILNLFVPLSIAYSNKRNSQGFKEYLEEFFLWLPGKPGYASLHRRNPWMREYSHIWQVYASGQAFLQLAQGYCKHGKCNCCPLDRKIQEVVF